MHEYLSGAALFLDRQFRAPTCPDLERTFQELGNCHIDGDSIYQGNTMVAFVEPNAKVYLDGNRLSHQTILERTTRPFHTSHGDVQVHNAIVCIEGTWYALAPLEDGAWEARREMTFPPPENVQALLSAAM